MTEADTVSTTISISEKAKFSAGDPIGSCNGDVTLVMSGTVQADVHPSVDVCLSCREKCLARATEKRLE